MSAAGKPAARQTGKEKEMLAAAYLQRAGMEILERNYRCRQGEIDLIGRHQEYLVFVEVKYRQTARFGTPEEAVTYTKQKKICRTADYYRMKHHYSDAAPVRYDVVAVAGDTVTWHQHAFDHIYH